MFEAVLKVIRKWQERAQKPDTSTTTTNRVVRDVFYDAGTALYLAEDRGRQKDGRWEVHVYRNGMKDRTVHLTDQEYRKRVRLH